MKKPFILSYGSYEMTHSDQVKQQILETGVKLWPYATARAIGRELDLSHSAILYHFGSSDLLQMDVARYAVHTGNAKVIVQLLASAHPAVAGMKPSERKKYLGGLE
jgi:AcrR family transcriptional regulator